jgi:hypothetical protein
MVMTVVTVAPAGSAIESAAQSMVDDLNVVAADAGTCNLTSILPDMRSVLDDIDSVNSACSFTAGGSA